MDVIGPRDLSGVCTPHAVAPTELQYGALQYCFKFMNDRLFNSRLPEPLITLQRKNRTLGYYNPNKFVALNGDSRARTDELALNPKHFLTRGMRDVCSTLAHEMCHIAVQHFGRPVRVGYHDRQWADLMKHIGLQPTHNGKPDGRESGYRMDHIIVEGGPFALAYDELVRTTTIAWGDAPAPEDGRRGTAEADTPSKPSKPAKRLKLVCPRCSLNAFVVPSVVGKLACVPCGHIAMVAA